MMNSRYFINVVRFLIVCLVALLWRHPPTPAQTKPISFNELDRVIVEELKERQTPGAAVAVVIGDRVVYAKGFGRASIENDAPVTAEMLFRLGSTTKMLTAAALVTQAEAGKLRLDAPLGSYVKGLSPKLAGVTAHQLLSHTAGLRDFESPVLSQEDAGLGQNVRAWHDDVFFTDPGKIYSYSSAGYWLAGFVAEELAAKPYADAMNELLFKPLGMQRTTLRPSLAMTYPLAMPHKIEQNAPVVIRPFFNNTAMWPGGSVFSNIHDLSRFVIALLNDGMLDRQRVLAPAVVTKLPAAQINLPGETDSHYGYGLLMYHYRGVRVVTHGGASRGYGSIIQMVPAHRFAVIVLTNKSGETLPKTGQKAMELALPLKPESEEPPAEVAAPTAEEMRDYSGVYTHHPERWEIFASAGKLFIKYQNAEFALKRVGQYQFTFGAQSENTIALIPGANGKTEHLFTGLYAARKQ